jgi:nucleolar GTP-binding protein
MVKYNFKSIQVVPNSQQFVDIVLTKTQRKTPTVVHPGYSINRIRQFYMRKIKFTQTIIHDKLTHILTDFPLLDDIHPFYADLMNVLYDRDHYKLALGQLSTARRLVDTIGRDYLKLIKFGDSLYRCKQLKRAALGRMVKVLRKNGTSLSYLEDVRQHMARLPSIDPNTRTLLVTGYPNVGKSSFMNKITRANVEVQPYAFTTKSLFVGHTDYRFLTWQVIDTPGILDGPLEERNTKEMQSITALAHLKASILYFVDISEECGYSIEQQVHLYNSIKPLFTGKPIHVILNKIDKKRPEDLPSHQKLLIENIGKEENVKLIPMSNFSEEGIMEVKQSACDALLLQRTENKLNNRNTEDIMNRVHIANPIPRDDKERVPQVPDTVGNNSNDKAKKKFEEWKYQLKLYKELDPDYEGMDWKDDYQLDNPDWKHDPIPEISDGKNVFDYWSGDIDEKLGELDREESARMRNFEELLKEENINRFKLTPEQQEKVKRIREKRKLMVKDSRLKRNHDNAKISKKYNVKNLTINDLENHLESLGMDPKAATERLRSMSRERSQTRGRKTDRASSEEAREVSKTPLPGEGYRNVRQRLLAEDLARKSIKKLTRYGRLGESDRHVHNLMPKHLFSGKRGIGSTDRR